MKDIEEVLDDLRFLCEKVGWSYTESTQFLSINISEDPKVFETFNLNKFPASKKDEKNFKDCLVLVTQHLVCAIHVKTAFEVYVNPEEVLVIDTLAVYEKASSFKFNDYFVGDRQIAIIRAIKETFRD